jgi:TrmH family RNA methyltransferase
MKRVVLCRPQGPRNVGSILRVVQNFGPAELWLVAPARPSLLIHPDFEQMAHGAEDVVEKIRVVDTLDEALADCNVSFGFTARVRDHRDLEDWRAAQPDVVASGEADGERVALVFGSEENGLTGAETDPLHRLVRIPTSSEHGSINLAMSVGLVLAACFLADAPSARAEGATRLPGGDRAYLIERLKDVLGARATSEPAREAIVASIERVFARAPLETRDARAWHLLVRALGGDARPQDYGLDPLDAPDRRPRHLRR